MKNNKFVTFALLTAACGLLLLAWGGIRVVKKIKFGINVSGHLKRAADSNTPQRAAEELETALASMKAQNMTDGYTSILWRAPHEDVGFWYKNLSEALEELKELPEDATPLEKSNMLMKLRETILDDTSEGGVTVTSPKGISIFPYNTVFAVWCFFTLLFGAFFLFMASVSREKPRYGGGGSSFSLIELMIVIAIIAILVGTITAAS